MGGVGEALTLTVFWLTRNKTSAGALLQQQYPKEAYFSKTKYGCLFEGHFTYITVFIGAL